MSQDESILGDRIFDASAKLRKNVRRAMQSPRGPVLQHAIPRRIRPSR